MKNKNKIRTISVSPEYEELILEYELSPTECFRKGVAVELMEKGININKLLLERKEKLLKQELENIQKQKKELEKNE